MMTIIILILFSSLANADSIYMEKKINYENYIRNNPPEPLARRVTARVPHQDIWESSQLKLISPKGDPDDKKYEKMVNPDSYKLNYYKGRLFDGNNTEIDTNSLKAIFVMLEDGQILISKKWRIGYFDHVSLASGKPVVCAGRMVIRAGHLEVIDDISYQYPSKGYYPLTKVITALSKQGISFDRVDVRYRNDYLSQ